MSARRAAALAAWFALAGACGPGAPGPGLPVDRAVADVETLAGFGPRPDGSPASARAAAWIEAELGEVGLAVERFAVGTVDLPEIRVGPRLVRPARRATAHDADLVVRFGPDRPGAVVFLAHYDSMPGAPGAIDDGAAVALLLGLARELAARPPTEPVWLVFTADEEHGLVGATALAAAVADRVGFAIAIDLVGQGGPLVINGASGLITGAELRWLAAAADAAGVELSVPAPHRIVSRWWPQAERADHGAFTARGVRAIHLLDRGGTPGEHIYLPYHTPRDRPDQLSRAALGEVGRMLRALVARPPPRVSRGDGGVWLPVPGNVVVPRWAYLAACGLLLGLAIAGIGAVRRRRARGPGVLAALAVWGAAWAIAWGAERLTAGAHPAPWVHAPLRHALALAAIAAGVGAILVGVIARWRPWAGCDRYAAAAAVWNAALGAAAVAIGAAELAWLWLVPAAAAAWLPALRGDRARRIAAVAVGALAIAPGLPILAPSLLRELTFHGFLPIGLPLAIWLAAHTVTIGLVIAFAAARVPRWGPGATFAVPGVALALVAAGGLALATDDPPCSPTELVAHGLACELER